MSRVKNEGFSHREQIGAGAAGMCVLDHLASAYRHSFREQWAARIQAGEVLLEGRPAQAESPLSPGQWLVWNRPPWEEPAAPLDFAILHRDRDLLAVAKPSGLPTLPGGGFLSSTLLRRVKSLHPEAGPLHRLGRFTSGIVLFARNREAGAAVQGAWKSGVRKVYRALIRGVPEERELEVLAPIGPVPHPLLGTVHAATPTGKASRSLMRLIEPRGESSLVEVEISTGRPHQIRIHMAAAGFPLLGDPLYPPGGVPDSASRALPGDPGYRLHAYRLVLRHPRDGQALDLWCAPPACLRTTEEFESRPR